jgi:hypothetical protein
MAIAPADLQAVGRDVCCVPEPAAILIAAPSFVVALGGVAFGAARQKSGPLRLVLRVLAPDLTGPRHFLEQL